ncbi:ABC transporter permease [Amycolatopsis australiensis]|uniref:Transport permease protein n=1 Tax=Amycolatopsis australiensis TaxID=546364 RepID=A0A1K1Q047_9PSEU|nr:ABC transporter permease [Amycolatopsis australiensis]SFW53105.1 ABC-2 type transport system permease protein [Amycolatopsis australiensis]
MNTFAKITATETKLFLRTPFMVIAGLLLPAAVLLAVGAIPGMTKPSPAAGGYRFIDAWVPSVLVVSLAMLALQSIPGAVATYREQGVLRRLATTPVHPANLLGAQLLIHVVLALAGIGLVLGLANAVYDVPLPKHPLVFLVTLLLGTVSMFSLGLLAAALARTAKAAGGFALVAFVPTMFLGGVYLPRPLLPEVLRRIGDYVPPGTQPLQDAWVGTGVQPLQLVVLAAFAVIGTALAAKLFRWE